MVQIAGNYVPTEFVKPEVILKTVGGDTSEEGIAVFKCVTTTIEADGDNYVFASKIGDKVVHELKFTLGKTFEEEKRKVTTTVTKEGNKLSFTTNTSTGTEKRTLEFSDSGGVMNFHSPSGDSAKVTYKRA